MDALDLRNGPPRSPREQLAGLYMLARTIDKLRATLPGGNLGQYHVFVGQSKGWADLLGLNLEELAAVVRTAPDDAAVVQWVRAHTDPARYPEVNAALSTRTQEAVPEALRERFAANYDAALRAQFQNLFDLMEADDAQMFG